MTPHREPGAHAAGFHRRSGARFVLAVFAAFTVVAALEATSAYLGHRYGYVSRVSLTSTRGDTLAWSDLFLRQATSWWIFSVFALLAVRFTQLVPIQRDRLLRTLLPHVAVAIVFALGVVLTTTIVRYYVFLRPDTAQTFTRILLNRISLYFATDLVYYWAIVGVYSYYGLYRARVLQQARLDRDLSEAQLRSLQAQLHPHFLFNTMNAICGYALENKHDKVIGMLTRLSDMLRAMLRHRPTLTIPLSEELHLLRTYIELQQMRLGQRVQVSIAADGDVMDAAVPPLVLQPIVENAIHHGIARVADGVVEISATCRDGIVRLEVADNGPGFNGSPASGSGLGMPATSKRLRLIYGTHARLDTGTRKGGGARVTIWLPYIPSSRITAGSKADE
jgi:two-component system, LytTR family, sensor kinase